MMHYPIPTQSIKKIKREYRMKIFQTNSNYKPTKWSVSYYGPNGHIVKFFETREKARAFVSSRSKGIPLLPERVGREGLP